MKKKIFAVVAVFAIASPAVFAQDTLLEYVRQSCDADISKFCSNVTPGDGRLVYCIAAHEDKISNQCISAFYNAASALEHLVETMVYVAESCATDIETHCADTPIGKGRILACLDARGDAVSEKCRMAVDKVAPKE